MSNALSAKMPAAKPKIAFIEPPERAVFILDRCARSALWDVAMLVASAPDSQAVRVAKSRGITVRQEPDPEVLGDCDRVIVGHVPFHIFLSLRQIMRDKPGKVLLIDEFLPELMAREEDPAAGESAEVASDSLPDLALDQAPSEPRSFGNELLRSLGHELKAMVEEPRPSSADDMPRFGDAFRTLAEESVLDETLLGEPLPAPSIADASPAGAPPAFERELEIEGMASGPPMAEPVAPAEPAAPNDDPAKPANATRWFSGDSTRMIDPDELDVETLDVTPEVTPAEPAGRRKSARPAAPERRPRVVESPASRQARSPEPPPIPTSPPPPVPAQPIMPPPVPLSDVTPLATPRPPALPPVAPGASPPAVPSQPPPPPAPAPWYTPSPQLSSAAAESEVDASLPAPPESLPKVAAKPAPARPTIALKPKVLPPPRPATFPGAAPAPAPASVPTSMPAQAAPVLAPAPEPAPKVLPSAPPPASRQMPAPPPLRFDARTFLGAPIDDPHTSIRLDFQDGRIQRLIDEARQLADATAVNLMLLEPDGEHLRVAAASGLGAEVMSILRPHTGVGPPGQAFRDRKPAFSRSQAFDLGESDGRPRWRVLASVPITVSQQSIGVVTVKFVSASHLRDEEVIARMDRLAHAMPAALIGAVDLSDLPRAQQREALQLLIDRLMSLDEALPGRLSAFAAALRRVIGAEAIRIFMLDSMEGRLVEIASHQGWAISNAVAAPSNFAFLREVMLRGEPLCAGTVGKGAAPGVSGSLKETSTIGFPIQSEHARCLMLLEEVPTPEGAPDSVLELLQDMVALLEEMINIEQGMVVQEFISELSMRMADRKEHIDLLPIAERANALLDLAIELVAAEVAIWIPEGGAAPEASIPTTSEGGRIRAWALAHAAALAAWMKRKGDRAQGVLAERLDPSAPCGPAPWIGVLDPRGRGVLVIFFDAQELAEAPRQVPPHVLWRVLSELCQLMPDPPGFVPRPMSPADQAPPRPEPAPRRTSRLKPRSI